MASMRIMLAAAIVMAPGMATAAPVCGGIIDEDNLLLVERKESLCGWPFKRDTVGLACVPNVFRGGAGIYVIAMGAAFPLNGNAKDGGPVLGFRKGDIREIAASDHATAGWIKAGAEMCTRGGTRSR